MNRILGTIAVGCVCLGLASAGHAQDTMNSFGAYPTPYTAPAPYGTYPPVTNYGIAGGYIQRPYGPYGGYGMGYVPGTYSSYYVAPGYGTARYGWSTYGAPAYGYSTYTYPVYRYRRGIFGWRARAW